MTVLDSHTRGDTFIYEFDLGNDWVGVDFSGGVKFTLRKRLPSSSITDDSDSNVVDQASVAGGEISFSSETGRIVIPKERTQVWPAPKTLYWDLQGVVSASGYCKTIDQGTIEITRDVTRSF